MRRAGLPRASSNAASSPLDSSLADALIVTKPIDADALREVLGAAVSAGRSRVLVVAREEIQPMLEPSLSELGI